VTRYLEVVQTISLTGTQPGKIVQSR